MKRPSRLTIAYKALRQLGLTQVGLFAIYQLGIRSGHYHRQLTQRLARLEKLNSDNYYNLHPCLAKLPERAELLRILRDDVSHLYAEADEIVARKVRLFGGQPVSLILEPSEPLVDWTFYERGENQVNGEDIKFTWEPARFGWACTLARAYYLGGDEKYAECFWEYTEHFLTSNPPYLGPQWISAQEAAIRLVALAFAYQIFRESSRTTPERSARLARSIAVHAERIPPTMVYARSQNNNHLISEALGLYTASALLPEHPLAAKWHQLGWKWLQNALLSQIDADGTYVQHSTNYHRLMLQAAMWALTIHDAAFSEVSIPAEIQEKLSRATEWLWKIVDPETGRVPNLGHNDGAYILPLTICPYYDYRPVVYSACRTFLHSHLVPGGTWSELSCWLDPTAKSSPPEVEIKYWRGNASIKERLQRPPYIIQNRKNGSWCYFRIVSYNSRPAHADQLNMDLWWRGTNLTQDPGTYLYNAAPPWDNSLTSALVHNTVTIDGQEFMLRAGRFLYLDWANSTVVRDSFSPDDEQAGITAVHDGYQKVGITHMRRVHLSSEGDWEVNDYLEGRDSAVHTARLHWLLPDWEFEIGEGPEMEGTSWYTLRIRSPYGWVSVSLGQNDPGDKTITAQNAALQLVRAGKVVYGPGDANPINGWVSPTYGEKIPALACILEVTHTLPISIKSLWTLPQ